MEPWIWIIAGVIGLLILICKWNGNESAFTVTCNRCGSTDVFITHLGIKCRNCGSEMRF